MIPRQRREIDLRVSAGRRLHVVGHVGEADLGQLGDHHVRGDSGPRRLATLRRLDRRGDVRFRQVLLADRPRRSSAVTGADRRLGGVEVDQVFLD